MRVAVLSDIHGNLPALEAVLREVAEARVGLVVNLGDLLSGPLWPAETAQRLMELGLRTLAGNHERQLLTEPPERMNASDAFTAPRLAVAQRSWLQSLPPSLWLADGVYCCHGTPGDDREYLLETVLPGDAREGEPGLRLARPPEVRARLGGLRAELVLCGHSHVPRVVQAGPTLVVNPGSVGLPAYDDEQPFPHRVEAGSPHARWAVVERAARGAWRVELRTTPYDWQAAAERAQAHGRSDWARALATGFVSGREPT